MRDSSANCSTFEGNKCYLIANVQPCNVATRLQEFARFGMPEYCRHDQREIPQKIIRKTLGIVNDFTLK
ncbi:hypothetical protein RJ641_035103 [Dillenia turbinata]|uniref:Uncharacterized protein n=1 Tax=Dillenia turbinata TaxID=194707 RepID=A0AAN8VVM1_9MAGN